MEHRREFKVEEATVPLLEQQVPSAHEEEEEEEEEGEAEESPQVHKSFFSDPTPPTRDVWIQGRGRGREISALLGAMRPLLGKLDMLLLAPPQGFSNSNRVKDGMRLLKDGAEKMSSCLEQLSELEDPPPRAKCWMNEARDLSYDMEDYIDSLIFVRPQDHSLLPNNIKTTRSRLKFRSHLKLFGHTKSPKTESVIIAETLSEFNVYVQEAIEQHKRYGLHSCSTLRRRFVSLGPMLLPVQYEDIVIDGRMNGFIKSQAEDGDQQLRAISVLGLACIGKTTLAKVLYNRLGKQYQCRAFIRVSKKPNMKTILHDMLSQLQRQHPPQHYMEIDLVHTIKQYLQDKRYLIIIDDVWATSVWDTINHAFPKGSQGSRIVTTTQIKDVAIACCCYQSVHVFEMKPMDDDHSRKLFFNRIFGSNSDCPEELKEISNKILEICDGLPLATISIANLVASQPVMSIDLFTYIHQSLCSCFSANCTSEITRQVLSLSYNNLPHYLKTCLLYLSMYQGGYTFCKDDLLKQWVAEGLIDTTEGQEIEKVAESYLHKLIGRRFIQPICINYNDEVLSCAIHDAVYDLIAHKSAEENFIVTIDYSYRKSVALFQKAGRLSLTFGDARYAKIPSNIRKSQVRSLRYFGLLECMPDIGEFKLLHVLNLQLSSHRHADQYQAIHLTGISELFQLIYLKIVCDICIKLPNSLRGLQCLETLDVMGTEKGTDVPWDIIYLPHLLHLSLPVDTNLLDQSVSLEGTGKLNHLQDLYICTQPSSDHLDRSMEALGFLIGGHGNLKTMVVAHGSSVSYGGPSKATIYWNNVAPPPHLQRFECSWHNGIIFYRIPRWMEQLGNLCILKIAVGELMLYDVGILRGLPALTALSLYGEKAPYDKTRFDKAGFLVLKYFKCRFTRGIAWLKFEEDAMPNLLKLKLVLNTSGIIRIEHMPSLRKISVKFGVAAAGREHDLVSNHKSNPRINGQPVAYNSNGDEIKELKQQPCEIVEEHRDEYDNSNCDESREPKQRPCEIVQEQCGEYDNSNSDERRELKQHPCEIVEEQRDEYDNSNGDESREPKQQPCEIVEEQRDEYDKKSKSPADQRNSMLTPESSSQTHVQEVRAEEPSHPGKAPVLKIESLSWTEDDLWQGVATMSLHDFTVADLKVATSNFHDEKLQGTYCSGRTKIYEGSIDDNLRLCDFSPQHFVIMYLAQCNRGDDNEWLVGPVYLQTKKHPHLVELLGFCKEYPHRFLVYEYMPEGTLKKYIDDGLLASIPWMTRLKIAVGAAKGLAFLHEVGTPMIYGDFDASNILLDSDYRAKLWRFGLAKENPLYTTLGTLTAEIDVYNFGVVLLELLAGRPSIDEKQGSGEKDLVKWVNSFQRGDSDVNHIMDPRLEGQYSRFGAWSTATTASQCLESVPQKRPSMRDVVENLELLLDIDFDYGPVPLSEYVSDSRAKQTTGGAGKAVGTLVSKKVVQRGLR